jgi:hypothetical protein
MATLYGAQMTKVNAGTPTDPGFVNGSVRSFLEVVTLAGQAATDTVVVARLPKGAVLRGARIMTDTSLGTSTIAIGVSGTTGKYRAAAVFTTTDTWEEIGQAADFHAALSAEEEVFISIGAAALPASGRLLVQFDYAFN